VSAEQRARAAEPEPRKSRVSPQVMEAELKAARAELKERQAEIERLQGEIEDWKAKFVGADESTEGHAKKIQFLNVVVENQTRELKDKMTKISALKAEAAKAQGEAEALKAKLRASAESVKSRGEQARKKSEERVGQLASELKEHKLKGASLQAAVSELQQERSRSQTKLTETGRALAKLKEELRAREEEFARLEGKAATLGAANDQLRAEVGRLEERLAGLGHELQAAQQEAAALGREREEWAARESRPSSEAALRAEVQKLRGQLRRVEEEAQRERSAFNDMLAREAENRAKGEELERLKLMDELVQVRAEADGLRRKAAALEHSVGELETARAGWVQKTDGLAAQLREAQGKLAVAEEARHELEAQHALFASKLNSGAAEAEKGAKSALEKEVQRLTALVREKDAAARRVAEEVTGLRREQSRSATPAKRSTKDLGEAEDALPPMSLQKSNKELRAKTNALNEQRARADELGARVAALEAELSARRREVEGLAEERLGWEEERGAHAVEARRLGAQLQSLRHENESLKSKLKFLEEEVKSRLAQPALKEGLVTVDQAEYHKLAQLASSAIDLESERDALAAKLAAQERHVAELSEELAAQTARAREQLKRSSFFESAGAAELKERAGQLERELEAKRRLVGQLEESLAEARKREGQLGVLGRDFAALKQSFEAQTGRVLDLENELSDKKNQILRLQEQLNTAITNIQIKKEGADPAELQRLQTLLRQTQEELGKQRSSQTLEVTNITKRVQTFVSENEDLKRAVKGMDARAAELSGQVSDLQNKLRAAEAELAALKAAGQKAGAAAADQLRAARDEAAALKARTAELAEALRGQEEELEKARGAAAGQVEALQNQLIDQKNGLAKSVSVLKLTVDELTNDLEEARGKARELELTVLSREKELKNQSKEFKRREKEWTAKMSQLRAKDTVTVEAPRPSLAELEDVHGALGGLLQTVRGVLEREKDEKLADKLDFPVEERTVEGFARVHLSQAEKARQLVKELARVVESSKNEFVRRKLAESALNASLVGGKAVSLETLAEVLHGTRRGNGAVLEALHLANPAKTVAAVEHEVRGDEPAVYLEAILQYIRDQADNLALLKSLLESKNQELARLKRLEAELRGAAGTGTGTGGRAGAAELAEVDAKLRRSNKTLLEALRLMNISSVKIREDVLAQSDRPEAWLEQIDSDFRQQFEIERELLADIQYLLDANAKLEQRLRDLQGQTAPTEVSAELQELVRLAFEVFGGVGDLRALVSGGAVSRSAALKFGSAEEAFVNVNAWNKRNVDALRDLLARVRQLLADSERLRAAEEEAARLAGELERLGKVERQFKQLSLEFEQVSSLRTDSAQLRTEVEKSRKLVLELETLREETERLRAFEAETRRLRAEVERLSKFEGAERKWRDSLDQLQEENRRLAAEAARGRGLEGELEEALQTIKKLKGAADALEEEAERLRRQLREREGASEEAERLRRLEGRLKEAEGERDRFRREVSQFEVEVEKYRQELPKLNAEVKRLAEFEMTVTRAGPQLDTLRRDFDRVSAELAQAKERLATLTRERDQLEQAAERSARLEKEVQRLGLELERLRTAEGEGGKQAEKAARFEREVTRLTVEVEELRVQLRSHSGVSEKLAVAEREVARWRAEAERLREGELELERLRDKLKRLERDRSGLEAEQLAQLEKENLRLKLELDRLRPFEQDLARLNERVARSESANRSLLDELELSRRARRPLPEPDLGRVEALERENQRLKIENARLADLQAEVGRLTDKAARLERENARLLAELEDQHRPRRPGANLDAEKAELLERELQKVRLEVERLRLAEGEGVRLNERALRAEREVQRLTLELEAASARKRPASLGDEDRLEVYERENRRLRAELERLKLGEEEAVGLAERLKRLQRENKALLEEVEELRNARPRGKSPLHSDEEFRRLRLEVERLRGFEEEGAALAERLKKLQRENRALMEELEGVRAPRVAVQTPLHSDEEFKRLRAELERLRGVEDENYSLADKLKRAEREAKRLLEELEESRSRRPRPESPRAPDGELRRLRVEIERLRALEEDNSSLGEKLRKVTRERNDLAAELEELLHSRPKQRTQVVVDDDRQRTAEREVQRLRVEIERLKEVEATSAVYAERLKLLESRSAKLEEENARLLRVEIELKSARDDAGRSRQLEADLARANEKAAALSLELERLRAAERETARLRVEIERLGAVEKENARLKENATGLADLQKELARLAERAKGLEAENGTLGDENARLKRDLARARADLEEALRGVADGSKLAAKLKQLEAENDDLRAELDRLRQRLKPVEAENGQLKDQVDALAKRLRPVEAENARLKEELDRLGPRAKALDAENKELRDTVEKLRAKLNDPRLKEDLLLAFQRLLDPEIKNAANLRDCADLLDKQSPKPFDTSAREFSEPGQVIDFLVDLQAKNRPALLVLAEEIPKLKRENAALKEEIGRMAGQNRDLQQLVDDLRRKLKELGDRHELLVARLSPVLEATARNKRDLKAAMDAMGVFIPRASLTEEPAGYGKDELKMLSAIGVHNEAIEKLLKLLAAATLTLKDAAELPGLLEVARKVDGHRKALIAEFNSAFPTDFADNSRIAPRDDSKPQSVLRHMGETMDHVAVVWEDFRVEFGKQVRLLRAELEKLRAEKDKLAIQNKDLELEISKKIGSISKLQIKIFMLMSFLKLKVKA
jgi:chromosome segregation ATPase